jgi:N-methylhydantoinase B/oxoprolinase/acetone carboxylase alpha subunit
VIPGNTEVSQAIADTFHDALGVLVGSKGTMNPMKTPGGGDFSECGATRQADR